MQTEAIGDHVFLSKSLANRSEIWCARLAVLGSFGFFLVALPFATTPLAPVSAFIPAYESALTISDLVTAALLFSQFNVLRSRAVLVLASGYFFTAATALMHLLMFPGVFSPNGLLGALSQSAAWLYMFWHAGFPLFVIVYALLKGKDDPDIDPDIAPRESGAPLQWAGVSRIIFAVVVVLALAGALAVIVTANPAILPPLVIGDRFTLADFGVISAIWLFSLLALVVLWLRRPHTVLDLWLMVVMCAWICDIGLAAALNGRYDLGWYTARIYSLVAAASLLIVLLIENGAHYSRLAQLSVKLGLANKFLEQLSLHDELTGIANRRAFNTYLDGQIAVAQRHKRRLALVLCDVDSFKSYNDHYGHQAGDECLKQIAAALSSCCQRPADMAARYGGEEFAMILPDTELTGAGCLAEATRAAVAQLKIPHAYSPVGPYVSISGGVAVLTANGEMTAHQLIAAADHTLYEAKAQGRNRMVSIQEESLYERV